MFARLSAFVTSALLLAAGVQAAQNQLQQVTANIGPNPNGVLMYVYKPTKLANPLPLVVAIHYCTGTASAYFTGTQYANLADTYGYIVIYPQAPRSGTCFDVNTNATLTHNGGGDSQGIASMITYAIANYGVSASHVFVTGSSSGAMMTNVMAGSYPNLFQAGTVYNGVPFACFAGASSWNSACAEGQVSKTGAQWGDLVRNAYPGYTGARPRMLLYHGTVDTTLAYPNYGQEILQWTNVLGVSSTPTTTTANNPQANYTKTTYGNEVLGYSAAGVGHTVPVHETLDLAFFGIAGTSPLPPPGGATTSVPPASSSVPPASSSVPPATTTTSPTGATSPQYGQCGGIGWTGPTACASPFTCKYSNAYYSQCL